MGTPAQPNHSMTWLLQPGSRPAEAVVWAGGRILKVPLIPAPNPENFPEGPAREVVLTLSRQRAELLTHWGSRPPQAAGFKGARALKVSPLSGRRWCFELPGGVVLACPPGFIEGLDRTQVAQPISLEGGRWWLWPDLPLAVDVGDILAAVAEGETHVSPLPSGTLNVGTGSGASPKHPQPSPSGSPPTAHAPGPSELPKVVTAPPQKGTTLPPQPVIIESGAPPDSEKTEKAPLAAEADPSPASNPAPPLVVPSAQTNVEATVEKDEGPQSQKPDPPPPSTPPGESRNSDEPKVDRRTRVQSGSVQGMILLHGEFIDEDELAQINEEQRKRKEAGQTVALGQMALELGMVTPDQLRFVMALSRKLTVKGDAPKPLALFLLEHNIIRPVPLSHALEQAAESKLPIEKVLLNMNLINEAALKTFVDIHERFSVRAT